MTVQILVTRRDGETRQVETKSGRSLMLGIRKDSDIAAICGGCASCGTCHVFVAEDWLDRLPPMASDEEHHPVFFRLATGQQPPVVPDCSDRIARRPRSNRRAGGLRLAP